MVQAAVSACHVLNIPVLVSLNGCSALIFGHLQGHYLSDSILLRYTSRNPVPVVYALEANACVSRFMEFWSISLIAHLHVHSYTHVDSRLTH